MRYHHLSLAAAVASASTAVAQNFRVVANFGGLNQVRTWYGDGHLYVGPRIPDSLENTLNFTIPNYSATLPKVVVGPVAPATEADLARGTFLAIKNGTGETGPVRLVAPDQQADLIKEGGYIWEWVRYGLMLLPRGFEATSTPPWYLEPTEIDNTFRVTWRSPGEGDGGLTRVTLEAVL